jgi:hypothetical protein
MRATLLAPTMSSWPRVPNVSSTTYGKSVTLPSGATLTLALPKIDLTLNALVNLTGTTIHFATQAGELTLAAELPPLELTYEDRERISCIRATFSMSHNDRARALMLATAVDDAVGAQTATLHVYAPVSANGFVHPLPDIGEQCPGVLVTRDVAEAWVALGSPYASTEKRAGAEHVPVFVADGYSPATGTYSSVVRYPV